MERSTSRPRRGIERDGPVQVDVLRVNMIQFSNIDVLAQTWTAKFFFHLRINNGAEDADLVKDIEDENPPFPKATLRPGAGWFLKQIDFPNALDYTLSRSKVVCLGSHLDLVFQVTGTFHSTMELHHFPVDVQLLNLVMAFNCANQGIVPVRIQLLPDSVIAVSKAAFAQSNLWDLHDRAHVELHAISPMPETTYPALRLSTLVVRKPLYFQVNVIVPLSSLTMLALLQYLLPGEYIGSAVSFRITYSVTILLTTATYKLFIASALPVGLGYTTLLDKYVLGCFLLQVAVVMQTAILSALHIRSEHTLNTAPQWLPEWSTAQADFFSACASVLIFVVGHVCFFARLHWASKYPLRAELHRFEEQETSFTRMATSATRYRRESTMAKLPMLGAGGKFAPGRQNSNHAKDRTNPADGELVHAGDHTHSRAASRKHSKDLQAIPVQSAYSC